MTDTKPKEPAVGDPVPMPADEAVAAHIEALVGPRGDTIRMVPLTADMQKEQKSPKSAESKDIKVTSPFAAPAPAGYDDNGQPLKTEEERRVAGAPTNEAQEKLADDLRTIDREATAKKEAATKAAEAKVFASKTGAVGICVTCKHSSSEHPGGKACTHTTATLECDCAAFVALK